MSIRSRTFAAIAAIALGGSLLGGLMLVRQLGSGDDGSWPTVLVSQPTAETRNAPTDPPGRAALNLPLATGDGSVEPAPVSGVRLAIPSGVRVAALAVSRVAPRLVALVESSNGHALIDWRAGKDARVLPLTGIDLTAIAFHPLRDTLFATGKSDGKGVVMRIDLGAAAWNVTRLWTSERPTDALVVSPLPFCLSGALTGAEKGKLQCVHRLFFSEKGAAGWQVRSIAEDGRAPYLTIAPTAEPFVSPNEEAYAAPRTLVGMNLRPIEFSPDGLQLHLIDDDGCRFIAQYDKDNWAKLERIGDCGRVSRIAPNGLDAVEWTPKRAGVRIVPAGTNVAFPVAPAAKFDQVGGLTPDGRGVFGVIGPQLAYIPIDYPLGDVSNAWQFRDVLSGRSRIKIAADGGVFATTQSEQLFESYEEERYVVGAWKKPEIVTTDVFWETASAAFQGVFSEIERRQAIPAFTEFIGLASEELSKSFPGRKVVLNIQASKDVLEGRSGAAAGKSIDDPENEPRGGYEKSETTKRYFAAMRSFAHAAHTSGDVEPLRHLSAEARTAAEKWISAYRPFVAPSRYPLPYGEASTGERDGQGVPYHVFPLSFGFDNHIVRSLIHSSGTGGMLSTGGEPRLLPSAVELAAVFGNKTATEVVTDSGAIATFPALKNRIEALAGQWRTRPKPASMYERWLEAMGEEWREDGLPWLGRSWEVKRLQTGLAAWVSLRHETILVNERAGAEGGEGGPEFERLQFPEPLGIVEPNPGAFDAIGRLYDQLDAIVSKAHLSEESTLGMKRRIASAKKDVEAFAAIARKEVDGIALSKEDNDRIRNVAGVAEYNFLVFLSLANRSEDGGIMTPDPVPKVVDVAGRQGKEVLEAAIGHPLKWVTAVPLSGRRQLVSGPVYSFYEFASGYPTNDSEWRQRAAKAKRPAWIDRSIHR